jgi:hypothetical protein
MPGCPQANRVTRSRQFVLFRAAKNFLLLGQNCETHNHYASRPIHDPDPTAELVFPATFARQRCNGFQF